MTKAICKINLGLKNQTIYVYDGEQNLKSYEIPIQNIANFLIDQPEISEIHLSGSKIYMQHIEDTVKDLELKKYSKNTINFIYDI